MPELALLKPYHVKDPQIDNYLAVDPHKYSMLGIPRREVMKRKKEKEEEKQILIKIVDASSQRSTIYKLQSRHSADALNPE